MDYFPKVNTAEMMRLADMLGCANIPYDIGESFGGLHICYPNAEDVVCSVIQHSFSYGGQDGKLEIMGLLTDKEAERDAVVGWLSAENVFERIASHHASENAKVETVGCTILGADGEVWEGSMPSWD